MVAADGFAIFPFEEGVARWARTVAPLAHDRAQDPDIRDAQLRHGDTWLVGLDLLPNDETGAVGGIPLPGAWRDQVPDLPLHPAQVSIIYPGYPRRDPTESETNHRYRVTRCAAHVDGLLPVGPERRRFAQEYHAYILALPLNEVVTARTVVWRGSHRIMQRALAGAIGARHPSEVDITETYHAARREVFETCEKVPLQIGIGQAALIHRFVLHGTDVWDPRVADGGGQGRMIAFFRPEVTADEWLADT